MNFFFITKSSNSKNLERVLVKGTLKCSSKSNENISTNKPYEPYEIISQLLLKDNNTVKENYIRKFNKQDIYFKEQFLTLELPDLLSCENKKYNIDKTLKDINFLFLEETYRNISDEEIDSNKVILKPDKFIEFIDNSIIKAVSLNKIISDNYEILSKKDENLLHEKNRILLNRDIYDFNKIITILKQREEISYLLLDVDTEITNALINLNNIKFFKVINEDSLIEALNMLKEIINLLNTMEILTNKLINNSN